MANSTRKRRVGSVRRQPNGRYLARIQSGIKADGSPRVVSRTFDTESDADAWLLDQSVTLGKRPDLNAGITVAALWAMYQRDRLPQLAKSTQVGYAERMGHVLDAIGDADVSSITHGDIQRMLDEMRPSVARRTSTVLSAVLTFGVRNGMLAENVMRRAPFTYGETVPFAEPNADVWNDDPFAAIEGSREVWNVSTALACMDMIRGLPLEPVWLCCVGGGLRVEEAFALRKMDVRRIVGSFDEWGAEIWVTQVAVHHATTREEKRKATKNAHSVGIVPLLEPFGERLWELVCELPERDSPICKLSATKQNRHWRTYFAEPPKQWDKHTPKSSVIRGKLHGLPYIPLSKMRNTHTTLCQEAGMLDSMNQSMHRNTGAVQQRHYLKPDTTEAAIQVSRKIR